MPPENYPFRQSHSASDGMSDKLQCYSPPKPRLSFTGVATTPRTAMRRGGIFPLRRLMYISRAIDPFRCTPKVLKSLAQKSVFFNEHQQITGFLIYNAPFFLQVLEGSPAAVEQLYRKIDADPLHTSCTIVMDIPCITRLYGDWHMHFQDTSAEQIHPIAVSVLHQITNCFVGMWAYLPKNAANLLLQGSDPSKEAPLSQHTVVAFLHIVEYGTMLRTQSVLAHLPDLLTVFIDICVQRIEATGGQIAKFINGTCMAYWPHMRATQAVHAVLSILSDLCSVRERNEDTPLELLHAVAGMHCGLALLCNAGTKRADFTLLGDSINTCARLSTLTTKLNSPVILSSEIAWLLATDLVSQLESAGMQDVHGRRNAVRCYRLKDASVDAEGIKASIESYGASQMGSFMGFSRISPMSFEGSPLGSTPLVFVDSEDFSAKTSQCSRSMKCALPHCITPLPEAELVSLTYISQSCKDMTRVDLAIIQRAGSRYNETAAISSELLYLNGVIAQTLEGPRSEVLSLFERIKADIRHGNVVMVHMTPVMERSHRNPLKMTMVLGEEQNSLALQDVLAQLARSFISLETYVPAVVVRQVLAGADPRDLPPIPADVIMLATDVCSFTALSEVCSLKGVWELCTTFIDICTASITVAGGEIVKLIGDCVTAYFPTSAALAAIGAAKEIVQRCAQMRYRYRNLMDCRGVLHCGVGLDSGPVTLAHAGSQKTRELVVMGEVALRVFQVEAKTRAAGRSIVLTESLLMHLPDDFHELEVLPLQFTLEGEPLLSLRGPQWNLDSEEVKGCLEQFREFNYLGEEVVTEYVDSFPIDPGDHTLPKLPSSLDADEPKKLFNLKSVAHPAMSKAVDPCQFHHIAPHSPTSRPTKNTFLAAQPRYRRWSCLLWGWCAPKRRCSIDS